LYLPLIRNPVQIIIDCRFSLFCGFSLLIAEIVGCIDSKPLVIKCNYAIHILASIIAFIVIVAPASEYIAARELQQ
jgi:hypothetical protein